MDFYDVIPLSGEQVILQRNRWSALPFYNILQPGVRVSDLPLGSPALVHFVRAKLHRWSVLAGVRAVQLRKPIYFMPDKPPCWQRYCLTLVKVLRLKILRRLGQHVCGSAFLSSSTARIALSSAAYISWVAMGGSGRASWAASSK